MRIFLPLFRAFSFALTLALASAAHASPQEANNALQAHDYTAALTLAEAAVKEEPIPFAHFVLGSAQLHLGQLDAAEKSAAAITRLDPTETFGITLRAQIAAARGQTQASLALFDQLLAASPDDTEALTNRGAAKFLLKTADRGLADFNRAIALSEYSADALFFRSQLLAAAGDTPAAAADLSRVLQLIPAHLEARPLRAAHFITLKLRRLALADLEISLESAPTSQPLLALRTRAETLPDISPADGQQQVTALLRDSATALTKNDATTAAKKLQLATLVAQNNTPDSAVDPQIYIERGDLLLTSGKTDLAKDDFRHARYSGDLVPPALLRLARLEFADKKFSDALELIAAIDPGMDPHAAAEGLVLSVRARIALAEESSDAGELTPAVESLKTARQLAPDLPDIATVETELISARRKLRTASPSKLSGENLPAALAKAHDLAKNADFDAARALYDRLLQLHPANPAIYEARLATAAEFGMNDPRSAVLKSIATELRAPVPAIPATGTPDDLALARANLAVHERPYLSCPYIARARLHAARAGDAYTAGKPAHASELAAALSDAHLAVQLDAYDPQAHAALAEALIVQKRATDSLNLSARDTVLTQAFASADRALALAPDDTGLLLWRGDLESAHGPEILQRDSRALRFYARATRSDPRSTRALYAHASASFKSGNNAAAIADYRKVLTLEPGNLYTRYELGVAQLYARAYTDAVATFSSLQQTLNASGDKTSADAIETHQLHAIALAAAGDDRSEALAKDVLTHSEWIGNADAALENLTQLPLHAPQLDRLHKLAGTPNPALPKNRANQRETTLDASPR
ncbi:MAG: tetratricopeptide repeat protein [Nibricoccus sp.]